MSTLCSYNIYIKRKGKGQTQSYGKSPYPNRKIKKRNVKTQKKTATKTSITERLRTDLGRSVFSAEADFQEDVTSSIRTN